MPQEAVANLSVNHRDRLDAQLLRCPHHLVGGHLGVFQPEDDGIEGV